MRACAGSLCGPPLREPRSGGKGQNRFDRQRPHVSSILESELCEQLYLEHIAQRLVTFVADGFHLNIWRSTTRKIYCIANMVLIALLRFSECLWTGFKGMEIMKELYNSIPNIFVLQAEVQ